MFLPIQTVVSMKICRNLLVFDVEIDIQAVQQSCVQIRQQVLRHRDVLIASVVWVGICGCLRCLLTTSVVECLLANLDSCRVKWGILVLNGADKHDILEPL